MNFILAQKKYRMYDCVEGISAGSASHHVIISANSDSASHICSTRSVDLHGCSYLQRFLQQEVFMSLPLSSTEVSLHLLVWSCHGPGVFVDN